MKNHVKRAARTGERIRGIHLTFAAPAIVEVLAHASLHFVYIDGEHGCFDWNGIEATCVAAERHGLTTIARIPDLSSSTITRFLDRGVQGIVAPHVESVQDAERVIEAACFAPLGARSFGAGRPEYGRSADRFAYMRQCNEELSICVMIESRAGLDIAGELAALPGIDYLSYGMLDLAQSLGHPGNSAHPAVVAAARDASARIHAAGKRVREDFMNFAWVNDILIAGARNLLDGADPARAPRAA